MAASMAKSGDVLRDRLKGALLGMFIGDALAMPVHWYYSVDKLKEDYDGGVTGYSDPKFPHRESMVDGMTYKGSIDIIPEDKKQFYNVQSEGPKHSDMHGNQLSNPEEQRMHYHHGLKAGENTLNMLLVRQVLKLGKTYTPAKYIDAVQEFLTQPQAHNDLYYEIYLRRFFENKSAGLTGDQAPANQRDIWSIGSHGGLLQAIPMAVLYHNQPLPQATARALEHMQTTHRSLNLMTYGMVLVPLLRDLIHGDDVEGAFRAAAAQVHAPVISGKELIGQYKSHKGPGRIPKADMWKYHTQLQDEPVDFDAILEKVHSGEWSDADVVGQEGLFTSACYPEFGVPAVFYFALKTEFDFERALLDNANAGGDNTGRGAVLGGLLGAALGASSIPAHLIDGLAAREELEAEIDRFVDDAVLAGGQKL